VGIAEPDQAKLTPLLRMKYHDLIADAKLGKRDEDGWNFAGY
jgi:type I restriction enzyme, R subunit